MSENKKPSNLQEVQEEYVRTCSKAGDLQYRIKCYNQELNKINIELRKLNQLGGKMMEDERAKQAAEAAKKVPEGNLPDGSAVAENK